MNTHISEIKSALRRCLTMGAYSGWRLEFNSHPLAASIDNHTACIDVELEQRQPEYFAVLCWILNMARSINAYCDANKVVGDVAAQYWLERFLWRVNCVADMSKFTDQMSEVVA